MSHPLYLNNIYKKLTKYESCFIEFYLEEIDRLIIKNTNTIIIKNKDNEEWDVRISKRLPAKYWEYLFTLYKEILRHKQINDNHFPKYQFIEKNNIHQKIDLWIKIIPAIINFEILHKFKKLNYFQKFLIDKFNITSISTLSFFTI